MARITGIWKTLDSDTQNIIKLVSFIVAVVIVICSIGILIMTKVNTAVAIRKVSHPTPSVTCVELTSFKDVAISCVTNKE